MFKIASAPQRLGGEPADEVLIEATRRGEDRAYELLYERYRPRVTAYVQGMVRDHARAEDISQEVFISALRRLQETDRPIAFKAWIYEIAKNATIDSFRRQSRAGEVSIEDQSLAPRERRLLSSRGPERAVDDRRSLELLSDAFFGLSEAHHRILVMRELEGLSYSEIGNRLGLSKTAVESTLFRARRRLAAEYEELSSGERCRRMRSAMGRVAEGVEVGRDLGKLERHLVRCRPCRRQAVAMGVGRLVRSRPSLRERVAAVLPLPFLRRRPDRAETQVAGSSPAAASFGTHVAQVGASAPQMAEQAAQMAKAAALVMAAALAGAGSAAVVRHQGFIGFHSPVAHERSAEGGRGDAPQSFGTGHGGPVRLGADHGIFIPPHDALAGQRSGSEGEEYSAGAGERHPIREAYDDRIGKPRDKLPRGDGRIREQLKSPPVPGEGSSGMGGSSGSGPGAGDRIKDGLPGLGDRSPEPPPSEGQAGYPQTEPEPDEDPVTVPEPPPAPAVGQVVQDLRQGLPRCEPGKPCQQP